MTGYATASVETPAGPLGVELRCVNSRYLDLVLRVPDELRAAEPALRELLAGAVGRGKLECRIGLHRRGGDARQPAVDLGLLATVAQLGEAVRRVVPDATPMSVAELLRWPGVLVEPSLEPEALVSSAVEAARAALDDLVASRVREGSKLAAVIGERADRMQEVVERLERETPALLEAFEQRLVERLRGALAEALAGSSLPADETMSRIRQEVTLHGMRIDVAEEIARLRTHIGELRRVLAAGGPVGKRLDFLMQELNREANTLGSKSSSTELTDAAMTLKLLIEQIREQVQNLE